MTRTNLFAAFILCLTFVALMHSQQSPAERIAEIQAALRDAKLDGWLFYDFRHSDPLAYRILKLDKKMFASRRWFYSRSRTATSCRVQACNRQLV
jgi:Xaa-Pro dipeptidase